MNIDHLVSSYGYWAVFVLVLIECLGVPIPGETALIVAGAYAGSTHRLNPWLIFVVAAAAAIIGNNIGYWVGDKGGYALARRYGPKIGLDERKFKVARYLFDRQGAKVVFFGRFVAILRTYVAFLAGTSRMPWRKFLPANAGGGIVWAGIYTVVAYYAGTTLERDSGTVSLILGIAAVIVIVLALFLVRHHTNRLVDRAEAAYPGPLDGGRWAPHGSSGAPHGDPSADGSSGAPHGDPSADGSSQAVSEQSEGPDPVSRGEAEAPGAPESGQQTTSPRPGQRG
jgi:membrane protein DedA with SNARE-associated domain